MPRICNQHEFFQNALHISPANCLYKRALLIPGRRTAAGVDIMPWDPVLLLASVQFDKRFLSEKRSAV